MPASGDDDSTTKSAIAPGTIEIRSNPNQDISGLSRDTTNSLNALGKIFDKKTVQEQQELARVFGEEAFKAVGDLKLKEGSPEKVALHALVGAIMADMGGGNALSGAVGAGLNEAIQNELAKITDPALHQWASALIGTIAGDIVGVVAAINGTKHNYLSHVQEIQKQAELDNCENQDQIDAVNAKWDRTDAEQTYVLDKCTYFGITFLTPQTIENVSAALIQYEDTTQDVSIVNVDALRATLLVAGLNSDLINAIAQDRFGRMTTKQATSAAGELGFQKTNYFSNGQPVYKKGNTYITPDVDGHNGGVWKAAGSVADLGKKSTRWGTYDVDLNKIGD